MNILILNWRDISHPASGGAEIVTMEHARYWMQKGHTVTWFTSWYGGAKKEETIDGIRMIRQAGSLTVYPSAMWYLLFHSHDYDVIVDEVHGFPFFAPLFTRTPVVMFIHEIAGIIWDFMYPFPINIIGKFIESWYFRLYTHCLVWTDALSTIQELVNKGIPKNNCVAIPCPIIINKTGDNEHETERSDNEHGAKQGVSSAHCLVSLKKKEHHPTYIFVSRVVKMKGIEEVIKAFSFIKRSQHDAHLWIVGGGDIGYIGKLKDMLREYGVEESVTFWGRVSEEKKLALMAKAHILLHASVKEGWGLVVLEAAYMGTPSVVYNVSGLCDVVQHGETGVVISDNSPRTMAQEALELYSDTRRYQKYAHAGKAWVTSLTWEEAGRQSLSILTKASNGRV